MKLNVLIQILQFLAYRANVAKRGSIKLVTSKRQVRYV